MNEMITRRKVREPGLDAGLDGVCVGMGGIEEPGSGASVCGPGVTILGKHTYGFNTVDADLRHFQRDRVFIVFYFNFPFYS